MNTQNEKTFLSFLLSQTSLFYFHKKEECFSTNLIHFKIEILEIFERNDEEPFLRESIFRLKHPIEPSSSQFSLLLWSFHLTSLSLSLLSVIDTSTKSLIHKQIVFLVEKWIFQELEYIEFVPDQNKSYHPNKR